MKSPFVTATRHTDISLRIKNINAKLGRDVQGNSPGLRHVPATWKRVTSAASGRRALWIVYPWTGKRRLSRASSNKYLLFSHLVTVLLVASDTCVRWDLSFHREPRNSFWLAAYMVCNFYRIYFQVSHRWATFFLQMRRFFICVLSFISSLLSMSLSGFDGL